MNRKAQRELLKELSYDNLVSYFKNIMQMKTESYMEYFQNLYRSFTGEIEANLMTLSNFPTAYIYIRETHFEFLSLQRYYFSSITDSNILSFKFENIPNKYRDQTYSIFNIQKTYNDKASDYLLFKADILKELREEFFQSNNIPSLKTNINWLKSQTDLIEFIELLIKCGIIGKNVGTLSLKEAVNQFASVFGLQIKDIYSKNSKAKLRKTAPNPKVYEILEEYVNLKMSNSDY